MGWGVVCRGQRLLSAFSLGLEAAEVLLVEDPVHVGGDGVAMLGGAVGDAANGEVLGAVVPVTQFSTKSSIW